MGVFYVYTILDNKFVNKINLPSKLCFNKFQYKIKDDVGNIHFTHFSKYYISESSPASPCCKCIEKEGSPENCLQECAEAGGATGAACLHCLGMPDWKNCIEADCSCIPPTPPAPPPTPPPTL